jgi:hypothetical protein
MICFGTLRVGPGNKRWPGTARLVRFRMRILVFSTSVKARQGKNSKLNLFQVPLNQVEMKVG